MGRYDKYRILTNASEYYKPLREERGVKFIRQYETPILHNPTIRQRTQLTTAKHVWKYGDRLYQLADQYYNDTRYWWVIAWYNGYGTEADIRNGNVIRIPLNLADVLTVLGAS
jgi:nucleoid-associated protein YgaU|tara:strand:+ start:1882 stop:2220 length:339 start_codon:yes stop_codon:yes gene_type:complete